MNQPKVKSNVIGIIGTQGGCGASTLALNLGVCLAKSGNTAAIIDANFQQPQIASMLHQKSQFNLNDIVSRVPNIDLHLVEACATKIDTNCLLLSPPSNLQNSLTKNLSELALALTIMKNLLRHWIIDLPKHVDRHLVNVIDQCNTLLLTFEPTLPGVTSVKHWLELLLELGYGKEKLILVANRCGRKTKLIEKELAHCFIDCQLIKVPNDFTLHQTSLTLGVAAINQKPHSAYSSAVSSAARTLGYII